MDKVRKNTFKDLILCSYETEKINFVYFNHYDFK
jgi:hypothetical protein